jgi:ribonuclease III
LTPPPRAVIVLPERGNFSVPDIAGLQQTLGFSFQQPALLEQALVHSSYINENPDFTLGHNERLEFLGDAVLDFIVAEKLYRDFPAIDEGEMTRLRAALVRRDTLAEIARRIRLGDFIYMGKGEEASGGRNKTPNLAGTLEALIAAVFLDGGSTAATAVVNTLLSGEWRNLATRVTVADFKSRLQELAQAKFQATPVYRLVRESGPDHDKNFIVEVLVKSKAYGSGAGKSKKIAEMEAARLALERLAGDFTN